MGIHLFARMGVHGSNWQNRCLYKIRYKVGSNSGLLVNEGMDLFGVIGKNVGGGKEAVGKEAKSG